MPHHCWSGGDVVHALYYTCAVLVLIGVWVRRAEHLSRVVVIVLQSIDAFTALVRLGIDVAGEGVHAGIMRHQSTIPSAGGELFAIPDGRHLRARSAHHARGAATTAVGSFHGSLLLVLLPAAKPEPDCGTDNDAQNAEDAYGDTNSSTCRETAAGCVQLAVAGLVAIVRAGRQRNGNLTSGTIRRHCRHYGQWRGGSIGVCIGGRIRFCLEVSMVSGEIIREFQRVTPL